MNGVQKKNMPATQEKIKVGVFQEDYGCWKILGQYNSYSEADEAVDKYSIDYPHAWVDILDGALA
jgi:hypothetical protein